ncbi:Hypothetical protein Minf_1000 [Methylacidiphilum infernorum V4]|uniref:Uncharacterized protein n=1 Tax=Methylacidiphilum infernorum (isolate V4) TaxID=481448 RepID=B3DUQ2_METI4|nr:Hypothetical protein Minf_1000 [Methylacidiphilum infernorum V4]
MKTARHVCTHSSYAYKSDSFAHIFAPFFIPI